MTLTRRILFGTMAATLCCLSCVETDSILGSSLVSGNQKYETIIIDVPIHSLKAEEADSLSGFNQQKIVIGAIRDPELGLTTRTSALTLCPMMDEIDFGEIKSVEGMFLYCSYDTVSVAEASQQSALQGLEGYELLEKPKDAQYSSSEIRHGTENIFAGTAVLNGQSDLYAKFSDKFAKSFADKVNGMNVRSDFDKYCSAAPGILLTTDNPVGNGGRINLFGVQITFDASSGTIINNFAELRLKSQYPDKGLVDTTFFFTLGFQQYFSLDSLIRNVSQGSFPQYALNFSSQDESAPAKMSGGSRMWFEGGSGLKPHIGMQELISDVRDSIAFYLEAAGRSSSDISDVAINKASLILPFGKPADPSLLDLFPLRMTPVTRVRTDTSSFFVNLTDYSNTNEDQGDIKRYPLFRYAPDITYHIGETLHLSGEKLQSGNYDIFLLPVAVETTTTTASTSSTDEMNEYYQYLMYQSYYNSMYGGYGGYGYGNDYYSNYYSYMLASMYAGGSNTTTTSSSYEIDQARFYKGWLCTGSEADPSARPRLRLTFSFARE